MDDACITSTQWDISHETGEALTHATTWMSLEHIMLSEQGYTQKITCCAIPLK